MSIAAASGPTTDISEGRGEPVPGRVEEAWPGEVPDFDFDQSPPSGDQENRVGTVSFEGSESSLIRCRADLRARLEPDEAHGHPRMG
jgi:hypothetical protein